VNKLIIVIWKNIKKNIEKTKLNVYIFIWDVKIVKKRIQSDMKLNDKATE
jgi:hypothetical protein